MNSFQSRFGVAVLSLGAIALGYYGGRPILEKAEFARAQTAVADERAQLQSVQDLSTVFRHVGKVVEPSVVSIQIDKIVKPGDPDYQPPIRNGPFGFGGGDQGQGEEEHGMGSGVIMEVDGNNGFILTNNHVAGGTENLDVKLDDGRIIHHAKVVGTDPKSDLAVVEIQASGLIPAVWGNSDELEKGDWVLAFGSPLGYIGSMTHGIVSAFHRQAEGVGDNQLGYQDFIQVDAPINPGNSGGPLVNIHGEVVGINTAIATTSGGSEGIGFAIPSTQAKKVFEALKTNGKVVRGWLGVGIRSVANEIEIEPGLIESYDYKGTTGIYVKTIYPNTPAFGKLKIGDIVTALNGKQVDTADELRNRIADTAPGTAVTLKVWRDSKDAEVSVTVGSQPDTMLASTQNPTPDADSAQAAPTTVSGMKLSTLTDALASRLGLPAGAVAKGGAVITDLEESSAAAKQGLQIGDVILMVGRTQVHTAEEAATAIKQGIAQGGGARLDILDKTEQGYLETPMFLRDSSPQP